MRIENTMVSGYGKPDEARIYVTKDIFGDYIPDPVYRCERCKDKLLGDATVYNWDGEWFCEDCMNDAVNSLSPEDRADVVGESIGDTEQMVEAAKTYHDLAFVMKLETSIAREEL